VLGYLDKQSFSWEVLIVLDGCRDQTAAIIAPYASANPNIRILDRKDNRGKGFTVREGMLSARGAVRLFTDADNSTDLAHFDAMKPLLDAGTAVVIASRNHRDAPGAGEKVPQPLFKRMLGMAGNLFIQCLAVRGIWDTQCGFKAFTAEAARQVFTKAKINGWGFDIEALALARRHGHGIGIVPAHWIDNRETHVTLHSYLTVLAETTKVRWNLLTGVYR
jgi:dolichyl-phosphate beta-glucosyltransferase